MNRRDGQSPIGFGTTLRPVLHNPIVAPGSFNGDPAFMNVMAARFFNVDVFPGLASPERDQRVPVIGSGDGDRIDRLVVENMTNVLTGGRDAAAGFANLIEPLLVGARVGVDEMSNLDARHLAKCLDVRAATAVEARNGRCEPCHSLRSHVQTIWCH